MATGFDLEQFKKAQTTAAMDTHFTPPNAGTYKGVIEDFDVTQSQGKQASNQGITYTFMEITWVLEDADGKIKAVTGQDKTRATQKMSLDLTPDGKLDAGKGKNISLGFLRDVLGQNKPNVPWAPSQLVGQKATLAVEIEKFTRKDGGDGQKAVIKSVAPYAAPVGGASAMPKAAGAR